MFQTYINHFLQSFANSFTVAFMKLVSDSGTTPVYMVLVFIVMFGWDLKKGIIVIHVLIWVNLTNNFFKEIFNLPRPVDIDGSLLPYADDYNLIQIDGLNHSPAGFFKPIPPEIVEICRKTGMSSPGFPSGHVAGATAIWSSLAWLTQKRWMSWFAILFIILTMISRMFLGAHFFADVCGGLVNGLIISILAYYLLETTNWNISGKSKGYWFTTNTGQVITYLYLLALPIALNFVPHIPIEMTAPLLGINLVILTTPLDKLNEEASLVKRLIRMLIAIVLFIALTFIIRLLPPPKPLAFQFMLMLLQYYLTFMLSIGICTITGLYTKTDKV